MLVHEHYVHLQGNRYYTQLYLPSSPDVRAVVCMTHDVSDHSSRHIHICQRLALDGYIVCAWDRRGAGKTGARDETLGQADWEDALEDLDIVICWLGRSIARYHPLFLYGVGVGASLSIAYVCRRRRHTGVEYVTGVVAAGTYINQPRKTFLAQSATVRHLVFPARQRDVKDEHHPSTRSRDRTVCLLARSDPLCFEPSRKMCAPHFYVAASNSLTSLTISAFDMYLQCPRLLNAIKYWPRQMPLLTVHGTSDLIASFDDAKELSALCASKDATFIPIPGAFHELHNEPGDAKWAVLELIEDWLAPRALAASQSALLYPSRPSHPPLRPPSWMSESSTLSDSLSCNSSA